MIVALKHLSYEVMSFGVCFEINTVVDRSGLVTEGGPSQIRETLHTSWVSFLLSDFKDCHLQPNGCARVGHPLEFLNVHWVLHKDV
jgi:hypothetical protein